ncbi:hypothetical protein [Candidatus Viridilinea mediisalina]|nr:hypothetical protein [Candidatus Viridilinea mediisalina]
MFKLLCVTIVGFATLDLLVRAVVARAAVDPRPPTFHLLRGA